jgi:hypothetical protein
MASTVAVSRASRVVLALTLVLLQAAPLAPSGASAAPPVTKRAAPATNLYVATWGHDWWPGTKLRPFRTPERAQQQVRTLTNGMTSDIVVSLRGGTYMLDETFVLSASAGDSGQNGHRVVYRAYGYGTAHEEVVTLSGGERIRGWKRVSGSPGLWRAKLGRLNTRQLYVNGKRASRAQLDGPVPGSLTTTATGYVTDSTAPQNWTNPDDVEFIYQAPSWEVVGGFPFSEGRCGVASITGDTTSTTITMDQPCFRWGQTVYGSEIEGYSFPMMDPTNAENSRTFISEPGTFSLDRSNPRSHVLYYKPRHGENLARAQVVAPRLEQLVVGEGSPSSQLHDVSLQGLTFSYAGWTGASKPTGLIHWFANGYYDGGEVTPAVGDYPTREDMNSIPANVVFHGSDDIVIEGSRFEHLGGAGLELSHDSNNNRIRGNVFTDISSGGIQVGALAPNVGGRNAGNVIENNWVHAVGREYAGGTGILVSETQDTTIAHNQVNDIPYTGIVLAGNEDGSGTTASQRALNNHVFDVMKVLADGGGIYLTSPQGTSFAEAAVVSGNLVHDLRREVNIGLYTDYGNAFVRVNGNVEYRTDYAFGGCSIPTLHDLLITDNFVDEDTQIFGGEYCGEVGDNVVVEDNTELGVEDPEGACDVIAACAAIVANAGLEPGYLHLLED